MESDAPLDPAEELAPGRARQKAENASEAGAGGGGERTHHEVAPLETGHIAADLDHLAQEFVSHHRAGIESGLSAMPDVEIGTADGGETHRDDYVAWGEEDGIRHGLHPEVPQSLVGERAHQGEARVGAGEGSISP